MAFHNWVSDSKSPKVSGTLRSIVADINKTIVSMVSTCPFISKFSNPFTNL